jgi:hypothetical protein
MAKQRSAGSLTMSLFAETGNLFRELLKALFDPYRPEMHYMRGPGPRAARKRQQGR